MLLCKPLGRLQSKKLFQFYRCRFGFTVIVKVNIFRKSSLDAACCTNIDFLVSTNSTLLNLHLLSVEIQVAGALQLSERKGKRTEALFRCIKGGNRSLQPLLCEIEQLDFSIFHSS